MAPEPVALTRRTVILMAVAVGTLIANLYFAQPLEDTLAEAFDVSGRSLGLAVTLIQVGYAVGLATLVPLGDLVERRRLLVPLLGCTVVGLSAMALAPGFPVFVVGGVVVGLTSVAVQILVPFAAQLAPEAERGRVVSTVMSGLLLGLLLARTVAGTVSDVAGWRAVFGLGAVLTAGIAVLLWRQLPTLPPSVSLRYRELLGSVVQLVRDEPTLRWRMAYGGLTFSSFMAFWTSAGFMLAGPAYDWSDSTIGLFALVGAVGALAARWAGRLADRGRGQLATGGFLATQAASYVLLVAGERWVVPLLIGVALMDLGCQGVHISNQSVIFSLRPEARSRVNTAYMTSYFVAGASGSALSALLYHSFGWAGVCLLGGALPALGFLVWVAHVRGGSAHGDAATSDDAPVPPALATPRFVDRLRAHGTADAVVFGDRTVSYRDLVDRVDVWTARFDQADLAPGTVVALESATSPEAIAALLALVDRAAIAVPLTALPDAKRSEYHDVAEVETIVALDGTTWSLGPTGRTASHALYDRLREDERPGLVLFSSGTTGRSKASVLDIARMLRRYDRATRSRRTLAFLNLDHIGGINTLLHTLASGGAVVNIADRSPEAVLAAVQRHRVDVLPTTPTFLNMVLISGVLDRFDTASLQLVTYGTEPMPAQTLRRITEALPQVRFKQTYGLSELGILPTKSRDDRSLWLKLGDAGFDHKIVDGVLWVRSDMAMLGYLNAEAPFDDDGYFNTRDKVEVDGDWMRILGRDSEVINVGGEKVYPVEVENVLLEVPGIADATVSGRRSPVTGMVVHAVVRPVGPVEPEDAADLRRRLRAFCRQRLEPFKVPASIEVVDDRLHSDRFKKVRAS